MSSAGMPVSELNMAPHASTVPLGAIQAYVGPGAGVWQVSAEEGAKPCYAMGRAWCGNIAGASRTRGQALPCQRSPEP